MTAVYARRHGNSFLIRAKGHATGSAEVCAAISALLYSLGGYLSNADTVSNVKLRLESGDSEISFVGKNEAFAVFMLCVIGFLQIEEANREYISVDFKEI